MASIPEDTLSVNKAFWNSKAASYDDTHSPLATTISNAIATHASFIGIPPSGKVLDFACGTGLMSRSIAQVNPSLVFRGMDVSEQMVAQYNARMAEYSSSSSSDSGKLDARAVEVDLMHSSAFKPGSPVEGAEWLDFDLAAVANALHHIERTEVAVARLVERLRVGGVLCVVDWVDDGKGRGRGHGHHHGRNHHGGGENKHEDQDDDQEALLKSHGVAHSHGFTKERITGLMKTAGLEEIGFLELEEPLKFGQFERKVFIARGQKSQPTKLGFSSATPFTLMH